MKYAYSLLVLLVLNITVQAQTLDYLEKSTSVDIYTSHNFHTSAYHDGYFYLVGEFWKDIAFGEFSVAFPDGEDDTTWTFVLKMRTTGEIVDLWHFESDDFTRINQMVVDPETETLTLTGQFWGNMVYEGTELSSPYIANGFVMRMSTEGELEWIQHLVPQTEVSGGSGQALAIDAAGNVFVSFETYGTITLEEESFTHEEETAGALITVFSADGTLLRTQQWQSLGFEQFIDITDMAIGLDGEIVIAGGLTGEIQVGELLFGAESPNLQSFIIREDALLNVVGARQYFGGNSAVSGLERFADRLYVTLQYANFLNIEDTSLTGSGSWGDLAVIAIDEQDETTVVQNFRLAANGGTSGVYAFDMKEFLGQLYIGGMYQGGVVNDEDFSLGTPGVSGFQYPFILSLDADGIITSSYDFAGSQGPGRLRVMAASDHHLLFGGEFTQRIALEEQTLETVNSTLFYGALWDGVSNTSAVGVENGHCVTRVYPTLVEESLTIETTAKMQTLRIMDRTGSVVRNISPQRQGSETVAVGNLVPGLYFLEVTCAVGTEVISFVKQ